MMRKSFGARRRCVCALTAVVCLLVSLTTPAQSKTAARAVLPVSQEAGQVTCGSTHLSLAAAPDVSLSSSLVTGRSEFDYWWKANGGFEAQARAFAGDLGLLNCIFNSDCKLVQQLWSLLVTAGTSHGETRVNDIALRLEGPAAEQAIVRVSGTVDGLLIGGAVGIAGAYAKVDSDLNLNYPGEAVHLVNNDLEKSAVIAQQFSEHVVGPGVGYPGSQTLLMYTGDEIHLSGKLYTEVFGVSSAYGVSAGIAYFQNVYPTDEVAVPGMDIQVEVIDQVPQIGVNQPVSGVREGEIATAEGTLCDADGDGLTLTASTGTVVNHGDGTWSWSYLAQNGPRESRDVVIQAEDGKGGSAQTSFQLIIENVAPTVNAGADQQVYRNDEVMLQGSWTDPAGSADNPYLWTWDTHGDGTGLTSGYASYGAVVPAAARFSLPGSYELTFSVRDRDGGTGSDSVVVEVLNRPPVCSEAVPSQSQLWPPEHHYKAVQVLGVTDPENDAVEVVITGIWQDEAVGAKGSGSTAPDGQGVGTATAQVRAERSALGNGRFYHIQFRATDAFGGSCRGEVRVSVPLAAKKAAVDGGALFDSTTQP